MTLSHMKIKNIRSVLGLSSLSILFLFMCVSSASAVQKLGDNGGANDHPHNLSNMNTGAGIHALPTETSQICIFCHTPHSASSDGPLWNRADPDGPNGDGSFPLYGSLSGRLGEIAIDNPASGAQYGGAFQYPNGTTRLCLSCHDGVTAIGEVINGGWEGDIIAPSLTMSAAGTINLDVSHPVSFVYTDGASSVSVRDFIETDQGVPGTYAIPALDSGYLEQGSDGLYRVQCTTCHDPHLDTFDAGYTLPMWRNASNTPGNENADYEATCSACHVGGSASGGLNRTPGAPIPPPGAPGTGVHPIL